MYEPQGVDHVRMIIESFYPLIICVGGLVIGAFCMWVEKLSYRLEERRISKEF